MEDDPYYFLQQGKYVPKSDRVAEPDTDDEVFIASLAPSYLKLVRLVAGNVRHLLNIDCPQVRLSRSSHPFGHVFKGTVS